MGALIIVSPRLLCVRINFFEYVLIELRKLLTEFRKLLIELQELLI